MMDRRLVLFCHSVAMLKIILCLCQRTKNILKCNYMLYLFKFYDSGYRVLCDNYTNQINKANEKKLLLRLKPMELLKNEI